MLLSSHTLCCPTSQFRCGAWQMCKRNTSTRRQMLYNRLRWVADLCILSRLICFGLSQNPLTPTSHEPGIAHDPCCRCGAMNGIYILDFVCYKINCEFDQIPRDSIHLMLAFASINQYAVHVHAVLTLFSCLVLGCHRHYTIVATQMGPMTMTTTTTTVRPLFSVCIEISRCWWCWCWWWWCCCFFPRRKI